MTDKRQNTPKTFGILPGFCLAVVIIGIILGSNILPNITSPKIKSISTTLEVDVKFNYAYPDRYTFEKNTTELLQEPISEFRALKYQFNVTIEGHWWRSTTRITPSVISPSRIQLQFYKVNMPDASDSFINTWGDLTVNMNSSLIMLKTLRILSFTYLLDDPTDYWNCEICFEAIDYSVLTTTTS